MSLRISAVEQPIDTQERKLEQTPSFRSDDFERVPSQDKFDKQDNTISKKQIAIGVTALVGAAALADVIFAHGKHIKKLFGIAEKDAKNAGDAAKPPKGTKPEPPNSSEGSRPESPKSDPKPEDVKQPEGSKPETPKADPKPENMVKPEIEPAPEPKPNVEPAPEAVSATETEKVMEEKLGAKVNE